MRMNMNVKKHEWDKSLIMIILAALPAAFPFGGRDDYLFPYIPSFIDTADGTFVPWVLLLALIWITVIWFIYGLLFSNWFGKRKKWFIVCNAPIIMNAVLEILYYDVLGLKSEDYPTTAYWIGSHIDKINPLGHLFGAGPVMISIAFSVLYYFFIFHIGYKVGGSTRMK